MHYRLQYGSVFKTMYWRQQCRWFVLCKYKHNESYRFDVLFCIDYLNTHTHPDDVSNSPLKSTFSLQYNGNYTDGVWKVRCLPFYKEEHIQFLSYFAYWRTHVSIIPSHCLHCSSWPCLHFRNGQYEQYHFQLDYSQNNRADAVTHLSASASLWLSFCVLSSISITTVGNQLKLHTLVLCDYLTWLEQIP
jgi:hypothetical protein